MTTSGINNQASNKDIIFSCIPKVGQYLKVIPSSNLKLDYITKLFEKMAAIKSDLEAYLIDSIKHNSPSRSLLKKLQIEQQV